MKIKFILIFHLILIGIMVGEIVHYQIVEEIITIATFFITGGLALQNIINRILNERDDHIYNK